MDGRRLIDATPFDKLILKVPDDVYDDQSYIRGVEDVLAIIRSAPEAKKEIDVIVDGKMTVHTEV